MTEALVQRSGVISDDDVMVLCWPVDKISLVRRLAPPREPLLPPADADILCNISVPSRYVDGYLARIPPGVEPSHVAGFVYWDRHNRVLFRDALEHTRDPGDGGYDGEQFIPVNREIYFSFHYSPTR